MSGIRIEETNAVAVLLKNSNPVLIRFDRPGLGCFVLEDIEADPPRTKTPLAMSWNDRPGVIALNALPELNNPVGWYRFVAPPGLTSMNLTIFGNVQVWSNGRRLNLIQQKRNSVGATTYQVDINKPVLEKSKITLRVDHVPGRYGGTAIPAPVIITCGPGKTELGDWSKDSV